jgi:hypothetical protein
MVTVTSAALAAMTKARARAVKIIFISLSSIVVQSSLYRPPSGKVQQKKQTPRHAKRRGRGNGDRSRQVRDEGHFRRQQDCGQEDYCPGCCWALMLLLFAGGVMNLWWIGALTASVLLEKLAPLGANRRKVKVSVRAVDERTCKWNLI